MLPANDPDDLAPDAGEGSTDDEVAPPSRLASRPADEFWRAFRASHARWTSAIGSGGAERTCIADPDRTLSRSEVTTAAANATRPRFAVRAELQHSRRQSVDLPSPATPLRSEPFRCKWVTDGCLIRVTLNGSRCDAWSFSPGRTHMSGLSAIQVFHHFVGNGIRSFASMALRSRSESSSWSKILWPQ